MGARQEILNAATRRFAERGFDGTSLSALASDVGMRKASLLYHFSSKDDLREAVLDELLQHWQLVLPDLLTAVTSGEGRFVGLTEALVEFFAADADRARLVLRELIDRPEAMRLRLATSVRPWITMIADYIRKGQKAGEIHESVDPEAYLIGLVATVLTTFAASPVLSAMMADGATQPLLDRQRREILRLARASLFAHTEPAVIAANETR